MPAMLSECARSFSKASYTIAAQRGNLNREIIKAGEALPTVMGIIRCD